MPHIWGTRCHITNPGENPSSFCHKAAQQWYWMLSYITVWAIESKFSSRPLGKYIAIPLMNEMIDICIMWVITHSKLGKSGFHQRLHKSEGETWILQSRSKQTENTTWIIIMMLTILLVRENSINAFFDHGISKYLWYGRCKGVQ